MSPLSGVGTDTQSNTDPFMMIITPVDHYKTGSCYGTASFCLTSTVRILKTLLYIRLTVADPGFVVARET